MAQSLKTLRIRGVKNTVRFLNSVVRFGYSKLPGMMDLNVMTGRTMHIVYPNGQQTDVPLPQAVIEFLNAFNSGLYPELESPV